MRSDSVMNLPADDDPATIKTFACLFLLFVTALGAMVVWG